MRLDEYFEIEKQMKQARTSVRINQRDIAARLALTNSSYSNYENSYSEPLVETILKFCDILGITPNDLLEAKIIAPKNAFIKTFSDILAILINLDWRGLPIKRNTTYSQQGNQLTAHLNLDIPNTQIATFIPDWNRINKELADKLMDEDKCQIWLEDVLKLHNVPIEGFI